MAIGTSCPVQPVSELRLAFGVWRDLILLAAENPNAGDGAVSDSMAAMPCCPILQRASRMRQKL